VRGRLGDVDAALARLLRAGWPRAGRLDAQPGDAQGPFPVRVPLPSIDFLLHSDLAPE